MLITKRIEHAIDINDPITLNTDLENNVLNILRNMFVGRCFRGCFILSVNKLLNKSHCEINQDGLLHLATMSVIFEVSALVYLPGDVIVGCLVVNRQDDLIICKGPNASIIININQEKIKP
jgi:DNA-directed RNA polymerase subunit E'/Rpb7